VIQQLKQARWALARLLFVVYIGLSMVTLVGGFLTAPLMTWYFFGDWRFWRHWSAGLGLMPHGLRLLRLMVSDGQFFMFSVPLGSPPRSSPNLHAVTTHPFWPHGESCGDCFNCCTAGGNTCPLLDEIVGLCRGYDSFYWRYFNCGRFPSAALEIEYYDCRKWVLKPAVAGIDPPGVALPINYFDVAKEHQRTTSFKGMVRGIHHRHADVTEQNDDESDLVAQTPPPQIHNHSRETIGTIGYIP
jgi:hypothetical protein